MKTLLTTASALTLATRLLTAQAQTMPSAKPAQTPTQRAAAYQGPKVVKDSKALGQKMVQKSKPTDMRMPVTPAKIK